MILNYHFLKNSLNTHITDRGIYYHIALSGLYNMGYGDCHIILGSRVKVSPGPCSRMYWLTDRMRCGSLSNKSLYIIEYDLDTYLTWWRL